MHVATYWTTVTLRYYIYSIMDAATATDTITPTIRELEIFVVAPEITITGSVDPGAIIRREQPQVCWGIPPIARFMMVIKKLQNGRW